MQPVGFKKATGSKTTVQKRVGAAPKDYNIEGYVQQDKRALKHSNFLITINTNVEVMDDYEGDEMANKLGELVDTIGFKGSTCELWGHFFKVATGRGKKWLDKKCTVPNPKYDANYNSYYEQDDKQGIEHWCSFMESLHVKGGVEWAPGTAKNHRNRYLHAHIYVKVEHRTRLLVDRDYLAQWFWEKAHLPHKPYVHVDIIRDTTSRVLDYITKNAWNKNSQEVKDHAMDFFIGE